MSGMAMDGRGRTEGEVSCRAAKTTAMILWVLVVCGLFYGLFNTVTTVADLFAG
jgi:hypothetical protein